MAGTTAWSTTLNLDRYAAGIRRRYPETDVYMTGRTNGVAYRNNDFFGLVDGLHFALQYQGNNENAGSGEGTNNGGNVSWRGKMATVLVSPATTIRYGHQLRGSVFVF